MAVDPNIKKKADDIRNKIYGKEVRESLASGLEAMSTDVVENEGRQSVVEGRQDSVESQWQIVSDEMTDKDVISAPEIIAARNGEANLKARLDKEKNEVTAQLAQIDNEKQDNLNILEELPSDLSSFNVGSLLLTDNIYWSDDFTGNRIDESHWHVYQSSEDLVTQNGHLEMNSTANDRFLIYGKKPIRRDIDGKLSIKLTSTVANPTKALFQMYQLLDELNNERPSGHDRIVIMSLTWEGKIQFRYKSGLDGIDYSWNDENNSWVAGSVAMPLFPFSDNDVILFRMEIRNRQVTFTLRNITQNYSTTTSQLDIDAIFGSRNKLYPYSIGWEANTYVKFDEFSYQRLGDK